MPDEVSRRTEKNYPEADCRPAYLRGNCVKYQRNGRGDEQQWRPRVAWNKS